ncbi:DUF3102 domain-containing protein [Ferirhizobium litorale]|uniref:DUF3102 domain-containing protein n=1 Tax=Ferirhizobium litorale TaxID=2927786 RepID=A0AAE3Q9K1_9HYPH|nr:DUF3102 domain-containing protein [Fererhizobium litorale]MDI7921742.1 DUF3102 domain-containing protein [Fererhizobium litorale]
MITEIEVEGLGVMRPLNDWQVKALRKMRGPNRAIAPMAFGLGMTVRQFKTLPAEQRNQAWVAYTKLMSASSMDPKPDVPRKPRLPRPSERVPMDRMIELGRELLEVKKQLPHGHFQLWIEDKSGISVDQARRFMRAARDAA